MYTRLDGGGWSEYGPFLPDSLAGRMASPPPQATTSVEQISPVNLPGFGNSSLPVSLLRRV